jgi:hypothetical protein
MRSVARKAKKGKRKKKKPKVEAPRILTAAEREELKRKEDDARRERAVQRQQTKRLNLVKQFWHGSLQSRTLPEEVLGVEPLSTTNARQALSLGIYGAKGITTNFKVVTIEQLYNKFLSSLQTPQQQHAFFTTLERALSSKRKAHELLYLLQLVQEKHYKKEFLPPGEEDNPTVRDFYRFKIGTAKRKKVQRAKRVEAEAKKTLLNSKRKKKLRRVTKKVGKLSMLLGRGLKDSKIKMRAHEFESDTGSLVEILRPSDSVQQSARNNELNFSNYHQKLFHLAQTHRPKTTRPKMNKLKKLRTWTASDPLGRLQGSSSMPLLAEAGALAQTLPAQTAPSMPLASGPGVLAQTMPAVARETKSKEKPPAILSPDAWPARDNPTIGSPPLVLQETFLPESFSAQDSDDEDYVRWYLENDMDNAIPNDIDKDLYNLASFQRLADEEKAIQVKRKEIRRPMSGPAAYLSGYVSQGQRYSVLRTIVSSAKSNQVGLDYLKTCQELKLPLPEAMVRLMSRQTKRATRSPVRLQPSNYPNNKASSFLPFNSDALSSECVVNVSRMSLEDNFAIALGKSLGEAHGKTAVLAYENKLQGQGVAAILQARQWKYADFMHNCIGQSSQAGTSLFVNAITLPTSSTLVDVNLAYNKLKDRAIKQLAAALVNCKHLLRLELSHNEISDQGAIALGESLLINRSVEELGLGWNRVGRQGAAAFAAGLVINEGIVSLDLNGWPYGSQTTHGIAPSIQKAPKKKGKAPPGSPAARRRTKTKRPNVETIKEDLRVSREAPRPGEPVSLRPYKHLVPVDVLAQVFKHNARLTHLDLSYCNLAGERVFNILSDGLKDNHTLLGLHVRGNGLRIDCRGFLQLGPSATPHTLNVGGLSDSRGMPSELNGDRFRYNYDDSCWICDGWTEQTFYASKGDRRAAAAGSPSKEDDGDDVPPLLLSLSFESFNCFPLRIQRDEPEQERNRMMARVVPPQPFRHYIRRGTKDEQFRNVLGNSAVKPSTDDWRKKNVHFHLPPRRALGEGLVIHAEAALPRMLLSNGTLKTDKPIVRKKPRKPPPPPEDPMKWLRKDWKKTKLKTYIPDDAERDRVLQELAPHALLLREVFQYYAFQGTGGSAFTISRNEITQLMREFGILDRRNMRIADLDVIFVAVNFEEAGREDNDDNDDRELERFEYVECLVRVAIEKFQNKKKPDSSMPFSQRVKSLMERHVVPNALTIIAQADGVDEFEEAMEAEEEALSNIIFENEVLLRDLFFHYSKKNENERLIKRGLQMNAFLVLLGDAALLDPELTKLEAKQSFIDAQDDSENSDNRLCDFEEYVEALIRSSAEKWEEGELGELPLAKKFEMLLAELVKLKDVLRKDHGVVFASVKAKNDKQRALRMAELKAAKDAKASKKKKKK